MTHHCPLCRKAHFVSEDGQFDHGDHAIINTDRLEFCPGVTCPQCAQNAVLIAELWEQLNAKDAEIAHLRALVAVGREMAEIGMGMADMFEAHWTVKDTDQEVCEVVRLWRDALVRWRSLEGKNGY